MPSQYTCRICLAEHSGASAPEQASVRSNVRRFCDRNFNLWRCDRCRSIHARDHVDLEEYYHHYPFFAQKLDWAVRRAYGRALRRLKRQGLSRSHRILDYGCGSGHMVRLLKEKGYDAAGYDQYSPDYREPPAAHERFDCIIAQDVVEHAEDPLQILKDLDNLAAEGALIAIGTPNAAGIDLGRPDKFLYPLHQPYHRHVFAIDALLAAGRDLGWRLDRYYSTPYTNQPIPFLSLPFLHYYFRCFDNNVDLVFERPLASAKLWLSPQTGFMALFGYFLCDDADIMAIFRKPECSRQ